MNDVQRNPNPALAPNQDPDPIPDPVPDPDPDPISSAVPAPRPRLSPGTVVRDEQRNRIGEVMGAEGPYLQLRPLGGGREWDAEPDRVRPATTAERLSAAVAAANAVSRGERA
ncbi:hypothetical protein ACFYYD_22790 [Streptomyces bluensis]|uniref:hypothetical protein n=1 Tax=Streptomyces bluensis TaxID=33897 RepID=UPI0036A97432